VPPDTWPQVEQDQMHAFSLEETRRLLAKIQKASPINADLVGLLFATGWRRAELARLTVRDLNLQVAEAWIVGKKKRQHWQAYD
jgi:integrase